MSDETPTIPMGNKKLVPELGTKMSHKSNMVRLTLVCSCIIDVNVLGLSTSWSKVLTHLKLFKDTEAKTMHGRTSVHYRRDPGRGGESGERSPILQVVREVDQSCILSYECQYKTSIHRLKRVVW